MPIYSSDSDDQPATTSRLFGRERPLHQILGGGKGNFILSLLSMKLVHLEYHVALRLL